MLAPCRKTFLCVLFTAKSPVWGIACHKTCTQYIFITWMNTSDSSFQGKTASVPKQAGSRWCLPSLARACGRWDLGWGKGDMVSFFFLFTLLSLVYWAGLQALLRGCSTEGRRSKGRKVLTGLLANPTALRSLGQADVTADSSLREFPRGLLWLQVP